MQKANTDQNDSDDEELTPEEKAKREEGERIVEELKAKAKEKFSDDEMKRFIEMGRVLCSKAVLTALICVVLEGPKKGKDKTLAKKLERKIKKCMTYNYCGFTQVGFKEFDFKLNISLSLVPIGYKTDIDIPHVCYAKDLFTQYDFLKTTARAYWLQFAEENKKLFRDICNYRDDVNFSELVVDPNNITTMYLDPECEKRIGIFCYYVDRDNKPYYKKKGTE